MNEIADILDKAADTIETRGLYRGDWYPSAAEAGQEYKAEIGRPDLTLDNCEVCTLAAINVAAGEKPNRALLAGLRQDAALALADHLGLKVPDHADDGIFADYIGETVGEWNDRPLRTRDEVVAALRAAATKAREVSA